MIKVPDFLDGCVCGAMPRTEKSPGGQVGIIRRTGVKGFRVICTRCGRVGEVRRDPADACLRWNAHRYAPYRYDL